MRQNGFEEEMQSLSKQTTATFIFRYQQPQIKSQSSILFLSQDQPPIAVFKLKKLQSLQQKNKTANHALKKIRLCRILLKYKKRGFLIKYKTAFLLFSTF